MARPRSFSPEQVLRLAAQVFTAGGYEGTSVDDLVQALNLHRGSLYKAFGSKRGLFLAVLEEYVSAGLPAAVAAARNISGDVIQNVTSGTDLDLLLIATVERGHRDPQVAALVRRALLHLAELTHPARPETDLFDQEGRATAILGARLHRRLLSAREEDALGHR